MQSLKHETDGATIEQDENQTSRQERKENLNEGGDLCDDPEILRVNIIMKYISVGPTLTLLS